MHVTQASQIDPKKTTKAADAEEAADDAEGGDEEPAEDSAAPAEDEAGAEGDYTARNLAPRILVFDARGDVTVQLLSTGAMVIRLSCGLQGMRAQPCDLVVCLSDCLPKDRELVPQQR